ncbi:cephalosporin hydroxylase family protein [Pseudorhodoferax sp. Leaf274]|uniref:cephalosporin hydroxylase family protein n=1 Tax=Pseudorhodoferax sp. Leaf274 TaxID=1736318 RepID=UPI000702D08B|nr:cephalosporin hydroxylase family protein [Pseudorhodoferax sp. Leaf274]KQP45009.1 cephalosporin hydroxylase [Pseudorhodoferax sp. Leaf274]
MTPYEQFQQEGRAEIAAQGADAELAQATRAWMDRANAGKYSYHFEWMGRPIIQYPQDIVAMQELIWRVQPDLIVETGIAHGGSLIFSAAMLELNAACGGPADAEVLGLDIDIRAHNRAAIEAHPMARRIRMIQGSSIAPEVVAQVRARAQGKQRVLVCLDSMHTHDHVLAELQAYAPLVSVGSYCVVFDTVIEDMPKSMFPDRPWGPGNSPKTALHAYLQTTADFEIDHTIDHKLLITVAPDGFLRRIA